MDELHDLQKWYSAQCDGDWEHEFGIRISTLDNPGWSIEIALYETPLDGVPFVETKDMSAEREWFRCWVEDNKWHAVGGPPMLSQLLRIFLDWANVAAT